MQLDTGTTKKPVFPRTGANVCLVGHPQSMIDIQEEIKRLAKLRILLMQEEGVIASQRRDCEKQIVELQVNLLDQR